MALHRLVRSVFAKPSDDLCFSFVDENPPHRCRDFSYGRVADRAKEISSNLSGCEASASKAVIGLLFDCSKADGVFGLLSSIVAVLRLGLAFFVLDPSSQTSSWILASIGIADVSVVLCDDRDAASGCFDDSEVLRTIDGLSILRPEARNGKATAAAPALRDLAYVVQTSGTSGGKRKTVFVSSASIWPNVTDFADVVFGQKRQRVFSASPPTFDPFYVDLFASFATRSSLLFVPPRLKCRAGRLTSILAASAATVAQLTPTLFRNLDRFGLREVSSLEALVLGGEPFPDLPSGYDRARVYNAYGVSEMSCWQSMVRVAAGTAAGAAPVFRPRSPLVGETSVGIDPDTGEIVVSSRSRKCVLSSGEGGVDDEWRPAFRTGDAGRADPSGNVYCLGRLDPNDAKVNGKRTSTLEVQEAVSEAVGSSAVVCLATGGGGVAAFCIADDGAADWMEICLKKLPSHLVPHTFVPLEGFPLTGNGKVDEEELRRRMSSGRAAAGDTRRDANALGRLWRKYTGRRPSAESNFIDDGGDSIRAALLASEIGDRFSISLDVLMSGSFDEVAATLSSIVDPPSSAKVGPTVRRRSSPTDGWRFEKMWSIDLEKCIDATPLVVSRGDDSVVAFVGSHKGVFVAVLVGSGVELWRQRLDGRIEGSASASGDGKRVFVGCHDGKLYCLDAESGAVLWAFSTGGIVKCRPAVSPSSGHVVFGSYDRCLYCLDGATGKQVWRWPCGASIFATPIIVDGSSVAFASLDGRVAKCAARSSEGQLRELWAVETGSPIFQGFARSGRLAVAVTVKGLVTLLDIDDGRTVWRCDVRSTTFSGLAVTERLAVFGTHDSRAVCIDLSKRVLSWTASLSSQVFATPFVVSRRGGEQEWVLTLSTDGNCTVLDARDGRALNRSQNVASRVFSSSPVVVGDVLVFGSREDFVTAYKMVRLDETESAPINNNA